MVLVILVGFFDVWVIVVGVLFVIGVVLVCGV